MSERKKEKEKKHLSPSEIKVKICGFCAYQERSQREVRTKLWEIGSYGDDAEELIAYLIGENYINEQRFAEVYAGSKFRLKKWGTRKIMQGLKQHDISDACIKLGFKEIEEQDYLETIDVLIEKKMSSTRAADQFLLNRKVAQYLIGKGFESSLVWEGIKKRSR